MKKGRSGIVPVRFKHALLMVHAQPSPLLRSRILMSK
jgi:hypothetical protein